MITIALAGDVMLGRGVNEALRGMRPEEPWGSTLAPMLEADLRIINLECAITAHTGMWTRTPKVFHFRADPPAVGMLQAAHITACSLANNHTLDFETQGLLDTLAHLDAAGIRRAGAGHDADEAGRPALLDCAGSSVALLAFTDNEPEFAAGRGRAGTNYLPVSLNSDVLGRIEGAIAGARQAGAGTILFSNHWGPNMVERPPDLFRRFARAVVDRGADLYYGHSAHDFQGVEIYRGKPILYDTGDFLDDYAVDPVLRNDWSCLFRVVLEGGEFQRLEMLPAALSYARVDLAAGQDRAAIMDRMEHLCMEMGTALERRADRLVLERGRAG